LGYVFQIKTELEKEDKKYFLACLLQDARTQFDTQIEKKKFLFDESFDLMAISLCRDEK
jgi:hypothetical protein